MVDAGSHIFMRQTEFLDGFPAAIFRSTLEGTIAYCNRCFAGLFGYDSVKALTRGGTLPEHERPGLSCGFPAAAGAAL
jgi:PAS domain-containing protein